MNLKVKKSGQFLQGVSVACYAQSCISYDRDARPSVCRTLALSENDASYDDGIFND